MVFDHRLGKVKPLGEPPVLHSGDLGWRGYHLEQHRVDSFESAEVSWLNTVVVLQLHAPIKLEWKEGVRYVAQTIKPGQVSILPPHIVYSARSSDRTECLTLSFEPDFLVGSCGEFVDLNQFEFPLRHGFEDRFMEGICLALKAEVEQKAPSGRLYSESLATSLAVHLVSKYGIRKQGPSGQPGMSSRPVRQALEVIQDRLHEDLSLREISGLVGLSPFHFARMFKKAVGVSPHQFILRQRIERSKQLLVRGDLSIAAVAIKVGFYDQSHFALHFKRLCGVTPREFGLRWRRGKTRAA